MTYPELQTARLEAIMVRIEANPSCHRQDTWHCDTAHCFGGWAQIDAGHEPNDDTVWRDARVYLGLTAYEADKLFTEGNSVADLRRIVDELIALPAYDRDDYNRRGRDRYGYNRYSYDRDGYDGYDYDRDGYDGYDYDRDGYDRDGYDRDGLDRMNCARPSDPKEKQ
jgi:hypothetical protein